MPHQNKRRVSSPGHPTKRVVKVAVQVRCIEMEKSILDVHLHGWWDGAWWRTYSGVGFDFAICVKRYEMGGYIVFAAERK